MNYLLRLSLAALVFSALALTSCKTPQTIDPNVYEIDRIMLLLADGQNGRALESSYADVNLRHQGQISRSENRWMITYDTEKVKPEAMLKRLQDDPNILEAAFVKKTKE